MTNKLLDATVTDHYNPLKNFYYAAAIFVFPFIKMKASKVRLNRK